MATAAQPTTKPATTSQVARNYFEALGEQDLDAACACWRPGCTDRLFGLAELIAPDGVRAYFTEIFTAFPDFLIEVDSYTTQRDRCAVRWHASGTFAGPGSFQGLEPTGGRITLEGVDLVQVKDGLLVRNDAYTDAATLARQLGAAPPQDSPIEQAMTKALNAKTRLAGKLAAGPLEAIADGVWILRGGFPAKAMNVYFVADGEGVLVFDAGIRAMTNAVAAAGARMGGITRVLLGHGHEDHRGSAPGIAAPILCHEDERADAEGDGGRHYFDFSTLPRRGRFLMPRLLDSWDGGSVTIADTVTEGDELAGFRVIHLPGHAPGLIGLWRESDRLALVSDCFYTLDPMSGLKGHPRVPMSAFNLDTELARASIRKLAALEPAAAWAGHADPVTGDVRGALEQAAATT